MLAVMLLGLEILHCGQHCCSEDIVIIAGATYDNITCVATSRCHSVP